MSMAGLSVPFTPSSWAWASSSGSLPAASAPWTCFFSYLPFCQKRCRMSFALVAMTSLAEGRHPLGEVAGEDVPEVARGYDVADFGAGDKGG